jgi:hypothetical protein
MRIVALMAITLVSVRCPSGPGRPVASPAQRRAVEDTSRPRMPESLNLPVNSALTVTRPGDSLPVYYRNAVAVGFTDRASGIAIRDILQRYGAVVIGGAPDTPPNGEYVIEVPDPGTTFGALDSLVRRLEGEPIIEHVGLLAFREVWDPRPRHSQRRAGRPTE